MPPDRPITPPWSRSDRAIPRVVLQPVQRFLHTEAAGGVVLLGATIAALFWANLPALTDTYASVWHSDVGLRVADAALVLDAKHWVDDLAMAVFFFVAGLEIKRELVFGDLRSPRTAMLPIACALGGMLVPALLYAAVAGGGEGARGWGIPMATDIAFAVGVLALCGRRVPASLKIFLLTLAIVDDIGAIVVIAIFYSGAVNLTWLGTAAALLVAVVVFQRLQIRSIGPYVVLAGCTWFAVYQSGVHATIAGVLLGLLTPARPFHPPPDALDAARAGLDAVSSTARTDGEGQSDADDERWLDTAAIAREAVSPLSRLERALHPWTAFVVLPLFALANAGVPLDRGSVGDSATRVGAAIAIGLVIGKPAGVMLAAFLVTRFAGARLPDGAGWLELLGVGALAGIGFTMSIFVSGLAFDQAMESQAKLAVLGASVVAGLIGAAILLARGTDQPLSPPRGAS